MFGLTLAIGAVVGSIWLYVSFMKYHLTLWYRGRRLKAYPKWEELQQSKPVFTSVKAGPVIRKPVSGRILLVLGGLTLLWQLSFVVKGIWRKNDWLICAAIMLFPVVLGFVLLGRNCLVGTRIIICPYCQKPSSRSAATVYQICPYCKRTSILHGDFFTPEESIRKLLQFQDLPKL